MSWEECLRVTIPGPPVPKGRPRAVFRRRKVRMFTPQATIDYEKKVALVVGSGTHFRGQPRPLCGNDAPVRLDVVAIFPRPQAMNRKKDPDGLIPHAKRPDLDNVVKAISDGIDKLDGMVWRDDGQVQTIRAESWYAERGQPARTLVVVYRWKEPN